MISRDNVCRLTARIQAAIGTLGAESHPTFFEAVTIMALMFFAEEKCDLVIWETGLGGRLDATNIVTPLASVITNIQLDHQKWLGHTIVEIAAEKAGIIKPGIPVVTAAEAGEALDVITDTADRLGAPIWLVDKPDEKFNLSLSGEHQQINAALAVGVVYCLARQIPVSDSAINEGLRTTSWAGRMQIVEQPGGRVIVLDGAHNPAGAAALAATLKDRFGGRQPALLLGTMSDKDFAGICAILAPLAANILITPVPSDRGAAPNLLADCCHLANDAAPATICSSIADALARTASEPFVVVTGSLHLVGDAMVQLGLAPASDEAGLNDYSTRLDWSAIRAVTFDVGGTLIEPWPSVGAIYAQIAQKHGVHVQEEQLNRQFAAAWKARKNFGYSMAEWSDLVIQTFAGLAKTPPDNSLFSDLYRHFATPAPWKIFDDVVPCLERLKRRGLKLGIVSNWDERLKPLLRALELEHYFDTIIVSSEAGSHKPDAKLFETAAMQLGTAASAILHVGDSASEDFAGAHTAGFEAMLLRRGQTVSGSSIASLHQLIA